MTAGDWRAQAGPASASRDGAPADKATEERLLDATEELVRRVGMGKASMADVARSAGMARGTLYRYFESREVLFDALMLRTAQRFFADVAEAMDHQPTLAAQLGEFSERTIRAIHPDAGPMATQAGMIRMLVNESRNALHRTARFLRPYIVAARDRGEVRLDLDIDDASEWLARVLLSFTVFQAGISHEADDPQSVSKFVQRYAISGLA